MPIVNSEYLERNVRLLAWMSSHLVNANRFSTIPPIRLALTLEPSMIHCQVCQYNHKIEESILFIISYYKCTTDLIYCRLCDSSPMRFSRWRTVHTWQSHGKSVSVINMGNLKSVNPPPPTALSGEEQQCNRKTVNTPISHTVILTTTHTKSNVSVLKSLKAPREEHKYGDILSVSLT